ncbi:XP_029649477.2uncharacterized protein LOC115223173 [Octopus vulgaris]|uniref:XP_029649477.2uncharacterized protein LOC115223173 n=1 Tax=Octopus vulgaris TaxID=6645 RepID=A0AA36FHF4_OCTVU|nr:XP_029649477.2uncharacterized protein LOC115223173 [Octopus vulgaris]
MIKAVFTFLLLLYVSPTTAYEPYLIATFDMEYVRGEVIFTEPRDGDGVAMVFKLNSTDGMQDKYTWEFHRYLTDYREVDKCSERYIGERFTSETGTVTLGNEEQSTARTVNLWGLNGILGYTLLLKPNRSGKDPACATIMFKGRHVTAYARLQNSIGGRIIFRQHKQSNYTTIYSDLFYMASGNQKRASYKWYFFQPASSIESATMCRSLKTRYQPQNRVENLPMLPVGNLPYDARDAWVEPNVWLTGTDNIIGKWIGIVDKSDEVIACSFIQEYTHKTAQVNFDGDGAYGYVRFEQDSPYDPTILHVNFNDLNDRASAYHIHVYPVPQRISLNDQCSNDEIAGHWNPFQVKKSESPPPGNGTNDQYEVGDLSGKFGKLNGRDSFSEVYWDWNLPLFEEYSIIGRSFVVHRTDGSRWFCANVNYPEDTVILMARFWYPVIGYMMLRQSKSDAMSDTSIYFELDYSDGSGPTSDHEWKIAERRSSDWNDKDSARRCSSTGNVYNPFNLRLDGQYNETCIRERGFHCAVGDTTKRLGGIQIRSGAKRQPAKKTFMTTTFLPLHGPYSVEGTSVVIFDINRQNRLACATIYRHIPYRATMPHLIDTKTQLQGRITFTQETEFDAPMINMNMNGLNKGINSWAIYSNPAVEDSHQSCSKTALSSIWNPFNIPPESLPSVGQGSPSQYPMGDMSGKFGYFEDRGDDRRKMRDYNLCLYGPASVMERAMAVSYDYKNLRGCGNFSFDHSEAERWEARIDLWGPLYGYVHMWQYVYGDGHTTETWVYIDIHSKESHMTKNHKWRIYSNPTREQQFERNDTEAYDNKHGHQMEDEWRANTAEAVQRSCSRIGKLYNPFDVNTNNGYGECDVSNQERCAVGDLSAKHDTYNLGENGFLYVDRNLPLFGEWSVYGRSFVFFSENQGEKIMSCADIYPLKQPFVEISYRKNKPFDKVELINTVAKALRTEAWHLSVEPMNLQNDCRTLKLYFLGDREYNPLFWKAKYLEALNKKNPELNPYYPDFCNSSGILTGSIVLSMVVFLLKGFFL